ncbi:hypothetical protein BCR42DRAFT_416445 [Absidia repens]|uniref:Uncharacterized protein n=1 Tax=Absidia repens TaxID=90262 RepID=A0A1X2IEG3_9FUNG|nr:hypothetical protein BCR42DRAFT_416445 [Absidia repens]
MARPVIVELTDLRRSRSAGYRPKKKRNSSKGKNEPSRAIEAPSVTTNELPKHCESIVSHPPSTYSTTVQSHLPAYSLSDPPLPTATNSTSLVPLPSLSTPRPKRSKSTLMRIGSGLSKGHKLLARKNNSTATNDDMQMHTIGDGSNKNNTFVKRMASFGKRMKLQRV